MLSLCSRLLVFSGIVGGLMMGGCANPESSSPSTTGRTLDTKADSVAHRLQEAHGADAFASAPYLQFTFAVDTETGTRTLGRHFWDRITGDYRVEWTADADSTYVALFNVRDTTKPPRGDVYVNGKQLEGSDATAARRDAYARFINDTYWLLAPVKVFDPGVNRTYLPDSSTTTHDVLHLSFGNVGLTPDDEYWLYVSTDTGRLDQWAFRLQSMDEEAPRKRFNWTADTTLQAPEGPVPISERKAAVDGSMTILTTDLALPSSPPENVFSASEPMLKAVGN